MDNSKLIALLRTFSNREWKSFLVFLRSPYFNRNAEVPRLAEWLAGRSASGLMLSRAEVWANLYPTAALDDKQLNHLMSFLLKLAEQFVAQERWQQDAVLPEWYALKSLSERGLEKNYRFLFDKAKQGLQAGNLRDARYFYLHYLLEDLDREHFDRQGLRRIDDNTQRAADHLDYFYFAEKLKYACSMVNGQQVTTTPFALHFVEEVVRFVANNALPFEAEGIGVYARVLRLLTQETAHDDFEALKTLLETHAQRFAPEEMAVLYQYAINYCIRHIRRLDERFVGEALDLYEKGVESGIFLIQGKLSPWHFKNIINLALRQGRYAWTEQFIIEKNPLLEEGFKKDALHYNLAELYFHTRRLDEALQQLNQVEFSDIYYNLGAKVMLAKIYQETQAYDALDSLLHAFKVYLRRSRVISDDVRQSHLNFIALLAELQKTIRSKLPLLQEKIGQTTLLIEKTWLLKSVECLRV